MKDMLLAAWQFRHFIVSSIVNEFRLRFIRSRLGGMWGIIHPLIQVAIFAFILSHLMASKLPGINNPYAYAIYLMAGILAWNLFSDILQRCVTLFIDNGNLLKKISFPHISLPLIVTGSALLNNVLLLGAIIVIFLLLGHVPSITILWLPLITMINIALGIGIGLTLGILNVFMRDVGQLVNVGLQFLYWFTPIVYMPTIIPEQYRPFLYLNPMYYVVEAYHQVLVFNQMPDLNSLIWVCGFSILLLILALFLFRKASPEMVDML